MQINEALKMASAQLKSISSTSRLDAELLLANVLTKSREYLHAWPSDLVLPSGLETFFSYISRREQGEPIAYILGYKEFWSLELKVNKNVLVPRPETELLVELVLQRYGRVNDLVLADLGTGSGAVALALATERPSWHIVASDISSNSLQVARENAMSLGVSNVEFCISDWCLALPKRPYKVIVSNPPYVCAGDESLSGQCKFEPRGALVAGIDGLNAIRAIISQAKVLLQPEGVLMLEHGSLQAEAVRELMAIAGYTDINTHQDLAGLDRVTSGTGAAIRQIKPEYKCDTNPKGV